MINHNYILDNSFIVFFKFYKAFDVIDYFGLGNKFLRAVTKTTKVAPALLLWPLVQLQDLTLVMQHEKDVENMSNESNILALHIERDISLVLWL